MTLSKRNIERLLRQKMCDSKYRYTTLTIAENALANNFRRATAKEGMLEIYKCPFCNFWHIGNKKKRTLGTGR